MKETMQQNKHIDTVCLIVAEQGVITYSDGVSANAHNVFINVLSTLQFYTDLCFITIMLLYTIKISLMIADVHSGQVHPLCEMINAFHMQRITYLCVIFSV